MSRYAGELCVLGGFLLHLVLGTLYMFANITTYITAHLRNYEPTVTYDDMILVFATSIGVQGVFMLIGGIIETRIGAKYTCLLGSYILVFGILLSSQAKSYLEILIFYGAFFGVGLGLAYSPPISASAKWFPAHKGLVTGIIISGFGGGAFIFGTFANFITNPDNIAVSSSGYFESDGPIANKVPCMYLYLGVSYFMTVTLACYLISEPDDSSLAYSNGKHVGYQIAESDDSHFKVPEESREFEPLQLIRIPLAWHLATCLVTTALGGMFLAGSFKTFALTKVSSLSLARISTVASIFNSIGRIFWGALADAWGSLRILSLLTLAFSFIILTYSSSLDYFGEAGFAIWTFLVFFFEGGNFALYMPITIQFFGSKFASSNYGVIFSLYSICVVCNITVLSHLRVDFQQASISMGILTLVGFFNVLLFIGHSHNTEHKENDGESKVI